MTPRERVEAALRGELANKVPVVAFADQLPRSATERRLRNSGLCLVLREPAVHRTVYTRVQEQEVRWRDQGHAFVRHEVSTPVGALSEVEELGPDGTSWHVERLFKSPDDYPALRAMVDDQHYEPNYDEFLRVEAMVGPDFLLRPEIGYSPLHEIMYSTMGLERFAEEWATRRDEVLRLYDCLVANRRRLYPVVAASPALLVNYCGNVSSEVVGLRRFEEYYLPHYDEFAAAMHERGKLVSVHLDTNTWLFEEQIGVSQIDCIEAFTPPPVCDMSVAHARSVWHDKVLWVSFPSTTLAGPPAEVEAETRQLLREAASGIRFMLGFAELLPSAPWQDGLLTVMRTVNAEGQLPLSVTAGVR
jgi:hypothetical protein